MKISVYGIGYVGAVTAACLARDSHDVLAVDISKLKVDDLNSGQSPIVERGLPELISAGRASGRLRATLDGESAVQATDVTLVCVGTPSKPSGALDLSHALTAAREIGSAIRLKSTRHTVIYRSTMLPGSMDELIVPEIEDASDKRSGEEFGVGYYPEFLRESSALSDYDDPGAVVYGHLDQETLGVLRALQPGLKGKGHEVELRTAELIKYLNNAWHATKISFSNEVGNLCKSLGVDSHKAMEILCADNRLNISPAYMLPGFAFGGSCLPKDLRALRHRARTLELQTPFLDGVVAANEVQANKAVELIENSGARKVGLIGLSFKSDTDDLRESPMVKLAQTLIGRGFSLKIYDPNIRLSRLTGANLAYLTEKLPHIAGLLSEELDEVIEHADLLVFGHRERGRQAMASAKTLGIPVIDLIRIAPDATTRPGYEGICW